MKLKDLEKQYVNHLSKASEIQEKINEIQLAEEIKAAQKYVGRYYREKDKIWYIFGINSSGSLRVLEMYDATGIQIYSTSCRDFVNRKRIQKRTWTKFYNKLLAKIGAIVHDQK